MHLWFITDKHNTCMHVYINRYCLHRDTVSYQPKEQTTENIGQNISMTAVNMVS